MLTVVSFPPLSSPITTPRTSIEFVGFPLERTETPPVDSPSPRNLTEPVLPETMVSFVNALRLATRTVMRNGAMTYRLTRSVSQYHGALQGQEGTRT